MFFVLRRWTEAKDIWPGARSDCSAATWAQCFLVVMAIGGLCEQEVPRGQQDVPWLRCRGSKNSRKLLYFVEWVQECKMSDFSFLSKGLSRVTRRRQIKTSCLCGQQLIVLSPTFSRDHRKHQSSSAWRKDHRRPEETTKNWSKLVHNWSKTGLRLVQTWSKNWSKPGLNVFQSCFKTGPKLV